MQNSNDLIEKSFGKNKIISTNTIEILRGIISSVTIYDEFYQEKNGRYPQNKQDFSSLIELRDKLDSLERQLEGVYIKQNDLNITKRIEVLNNMYENKQYFRDKLTEDKIQNPEISINIEELEDSKEIKEFHPKEVSRVYEKEQQLKQTQIRETKLKIKKILQQLDKNLKFYGTLEYKNSQLTLKLNSKSSTNIQEIFDKISIEELVQKLDLEDYKKIYYQEYGEDWLNDNYYQKFQLNETSFIQALFLKLPELKILNQLKKTKGSNLNNINNIEKEGIKIARTLIMIDQLADLNTFMKKTNPLTFQYIENLLRNLIIGTGKARELLMARIKEEVTKVSEISLETSSEVKDARNLISTIDQVAKLKANTGNYPKPPNIQNQLQNFYRKRLGLGIPVHRNQDETNNYPATPEKHESPSLTKSKIKSKIRNFVKQIIPKSNK